jgi:hypothetical protein
VFDVVSGFSALPTVFLRVGTVSQSAFQNQGEHFTCSLSQLFLNCRTCFLLAAVMYFVFCFFMFGVSLPHVYQTFCTFVVLCFLIVLVLSFCCRSCFSKNVFFLKMFFSPGLTDKFNGFDDFDDDVDLLTLEVSCGPTILAQFSWKLIRPLSEFLFF